MEDIRLGKKIIGHKHPAYIIAEIGLNHQGDIVLAKKLIDIAVEAGADCVKFQKRNLSKLYKKEVLENPQQQEHSLQYLIGHIIKSELTEEEMEQLREEIGKMEKAEEERGLEVELEKEEDSLDLDEDDDGWE